MDDLWAELDDVATKASAHAATFGERVRSMWACLEPEVAKAARAWSGSRLGYHAEVYITEMQPAGPGEVWDAAHGPPDGGFVNRTRGERWTQWDREGVFDWLLEQARLTRDDMKRFDLMTEDARARLRALRDQVRPAVDVLAARQADHPGLQRAQSSIASLNADLRESEAIRARLAGTYRSSDLLAMSQGLRLPVHEHLEMQFALRLGISGEFETLARECRYVRDYLRMQERVAAAFDRPQQVQPSTESRCDRCTVLLLAANPDMNLSLDEEVRAVEESIRASEHRAQIQFRSRWAARPADLLRAMNELHPAVVHFSGHGDPQAAIYLHDGAAGAKAVSGSALEMMFDATGCARVVVLASCFSAKQAKALLKSVDCVIGMKRELGDEAARAFSGAFYNAVGSGSNVKDAYKQGCAAIALEGLGDEKVPVLFVRPGVEIASLVLVPQEQASAPGRPSVSG